MDEFKQDRNVVDDDEKKRSLDLTTYKFVPPDADILDEPIVYYAANIQWAKFLEGHVSWLASIAAWPEATDEAYRAIRQILIFLRRVTLPTGDFDCGDVEDCLETSTIINNIITNITNITNQITEIQHEQEAGNPLPPNPDMADSGNSVCRGAHFVVSRLSEAMLDLWVKAKTLTLEEFVNSLMSLLSFGFIPSVAFWQFVLAMTNPDLADEAIEHADLVQQYFFCSNWNAAQAIELINADGEMTENEKALWIVTIELFRQGQFDEWGLVGTLGTTEYDCTGGCPAVTVYDFAGIYEPVGDEDLIVAGNSWDIVQNGHFDGALGYCPDANPMIIEKALPEQCSILAYIVAIRRGGHCLSHQYEIWYRGASGEDTPQWSPTNTTTSADYEVFTNSITPALLDKARINSHFHVCIGGGTEEAAIGWVKLITSGVAPT